MNDVNVIYWCRDMMLQNSKVDGDIVYSAARLAEEDDNMYKLLTDYAFYESNRSYQISIYNDIVEYMEERGLV